MDSFYIGYRDPLFGIIIFFLLIFIVSFVNYWWSVYKNKNEESNIQKFIDKFQIDDTKNEYKIIFEDKNLTLESIILLAKSYKKIGEYEKSIGIYLYALKKYTKRAQKQQILFLLGKVYLKAGFIERAREVFIESLKISPRHEESLKYLTITYDILKKYDKALEVLDALEELGSETKKEKIYLKALYISSKNIQDSEKEKLLYDLASLKSTQRLYVEFLLKSGRSINFQKIKDFDFLNIFDILWRMNESLFDMDFVKNHPFLGDILSARGFFYKEKESDIFELDILKSLVKSGYKKADLSFEYFCSNCKNTYPFYFSRCPNCHSIDSVQILPELTKKVNQSEISTYI
jgi:lipopolysaccharide biosynthesis regulator YciM